MSLNDKSLKEFAELLASKAPTPGGGGAAALTGALGIALCSMAGNLTLGRKKYADVEADVLRMLEKGESLRERLLALIDKDAEMFAPLAEAYSVPKDNPDRDAILENATMGACTAPMEILRLCCECVELLEEMLEKGSKMLVSDVGCGALCCRAAIDSAALNVFINTKSLKNRVEAEKLENEVDRLTAEYSTRAAAIADEVRNRLRKGE